jgi:hypothetical protein
LGALSAIVVILVIALIIAAICVKKKKTEKTLHTIAVAVRYPGYSLVRALGGCEMYCTSM